MYLIYQNIIFDRLNEMNLAKFAERERERNYNHVLYMNLIDQTLKANLNTSSERYLIFTEKQDILKLKI